MNHCRLGWYTLTEGGGAQTPSPMLTPYADLHARWPSFEDFQACVTGVVDSLEAERLYDPRLENAHETAGRFSGLF
jgi:hypothetical protein